MDETIFIPDKEDANLPAYTEWGYNSFGAEYDREYFLSSDAIVPCKIVYNDDLLQFSLSGKIGKYRDMTLFFTFPFAQISDYKNLVQLNNVKIDLSANDCTVKMLQGSTETTLNVLGGELYFKRTQLLSIDDKVDRVILSGTFEVRFLLNNLPAYISNGRFDMGINEAVFYSY
jgi:hypothetical protein